MFEKNVVQLTAEIQRYAAKTLELLVRRRLAVEAVTTAERAAGESLLDAIEGTSVPMDTVLKTRAELSAIDAGIVACRKRRLQAITTKCAGEGVGLRKQVAQLQAELEKLEAKTLVHIRAITELQGRDFTAVPTATSSGLPRSAQLQNEISGLEARAEALEREPVPTSGSVDLSDQTGTDALVGAVLRFEGDVPSVPEILDWAASCDRGRFGNNARRFYLSWKNGVIDQQESYTQVAALARFAPGYLIGSDIFRAAEQSRGFGI